MSRNPCTIFFATALCLWVAGCASSRTVNGSFDQVWGATRVAVEKAGPAGMRVTAEDHEQGKLSAMLVDGFGNVYLEANVRPMEESGKQCRVTVDAWVRELPFFLSMDKHDLEIQVLDAVEEQLTRKQQRGPGDLFR